VNVGATIEQQRHHVCRSADDRTVQGMTPSAVDIVNEQWLLLEEGADARQRAGFGGLMDRMILGRGRGHEPSRRINHVRGSYYLPESRLRDRPPHPADLKNRSGDATETEIAMTQIGHLHRRWSKAADDKDADDALGREFAFARTLIKARTAAGPSQSQLTRRMKTLQTVIILSSARNAGVLGAS
jgi:hypothetical protein